MFRWLFPLVGLLLLFGCEGLLGIDERTLDVGQLTVDGYEGCKPSDGVCEGCTSDWHGCICKDWKKKGEAQLRVDCAELAPESIRPAEIRSAEKALEAFEERTKNETKVPNPFLIAFDQDFCHEPPEADACLECFCGDCGEGVDICAEDKGCRAIMTCYMLSDCDPTEKQESGSCAESTECGDVIKDNGTLSGDSYRKFQAAMDCVADEDCPCDDGPNPATGPVIGCDSASGCRCGNCWDDCFCEGKNQGQCQLECGDADCVPEQNCSNCLDCMDTCLCEGQRDPAACTQMCFNESTDQCTPNQGCDCPDCFSKCICEGRKDAACDAECGGTECSPANDCNDCNDCFGLCLCEGENEAFCADVCLPPVVLCDPIDNCVGCSTCVGACACEGKKPFHECLTSCDAASCDGADGPEDCASCDTCTSACGCEGKGELDCRTECAAADCSVSFAEPCDQCACDLCGFEFAACNDQKHCPSLMDCITRTGCIGIEECAREEYCQEEVQALGGVDSPAMGVAEALHSCRLREGCGCGLPGLATPPGQTFSITCGGNSCDAFLPLPPDPIAWACCVESTELCGLDMSSIFGGPAFCAPRRGPGTLTDDCPELRPDTPPWGQGEVLAGCCRPNGRCGFQDVVLDLGCAPSNAFGITDPISCTP